MNGRLERIRDDYQALKSLERTRKKLAEISDEMYKYEPKTMQYRESFVITRTMLEQFVSSVELDIKLISEKEDLK